MADFLDFSINLQALGIGWGTLLMFAMMVGLLLSGMPLAFVTLLVALIFALGWFGPMSIPLITSRVYSFVMNFVFVSVPMFVLMAAILDRSGIARDLFDAMKLFAGRIRGGVAVQTVFVSVILAAMSGIIGGEIVLLGLIALPQMLRLGYDRNLAIGVVCAGGSLGTMIPPSIVLIIYGLTANVSIGELFTAAFLPGFMLAMFYVAYILVRAYFTPGVDIFETPEELVVLADVPGVAPDTVDVHLEGDELTLEGRVAANEYEGLKPLHVEYGVGGFYRRFTLGETIDRSKIVAEVRDGVLTLRLPKAEQARPRRIEVRAS